LYLSDIFLLYFIVFICYFKIIILLKMSNFGTGTNEKWSGWKFHDPMNAQDIYVYYPMSIFRNYSHNIYNIKNNDG
jgi:hypothetical protein